MDLVGPIARAFDLISSEYSWDDDQILDKPLRRIRQILAAIGLRKAEQTKNERLIISWQTRSLAMVAAAAGSNASEDLMKFASNLTIDTEEFQEFGNEKPKVAEAKKIPIHATTQDQAVKSNFEKAADRNNFDMLGLFGQGIQTAKPGQ